MTSLLVALMLTADPLVVELKLGEPVPFDATCLTKAQARKVDSEKASAEAELAAAKKSSLVSVPVLIGLVAGALVVGAAAGSGVVLATTNRQTPK